MAECKAAGRHKRSKSMQAYKLGNRADVNHDKKIARHKKRMEKHRLHLIARSNQGKILRGETREKRRIGMSPKIPIHLQVAAPQMSRPRERTRIQRNNINLHQVGL